MEAVVAFEEKSLDNNLASVIVGSFITTVLCSFSLIHF